MINRYEIKDKYEQFKHWQQRPMKFVNSDEEHRCNCCGTTYSGNYCPCCAQKSTIGHISWKSVHQSVMDIWGLGTRSLLYSIWQLLWRPGYFINDYINGKRQVSFPPVKMLFIITVIYSVIVYWFFAQHLGLYVGEHNDANRKILSEYYTWIEAHYSWMMLITSILAIIPTWIMFRYAPRNTCHTLPEGFFIQIFLSVLIVVLHFIFIPIGLLAPKALNIVISIFMMIYYIISYKQLFGYGLWGTIWRQGFVMFFNVFCEFALIVGLFGMNFSEVTNQQFNPDQATLMRSIATGLSLFFAFLSIAAGFIINLIATRKDRKNIMESR